MMRTLFFALSRKAQSLSASPYIGRYSVVRYVVSEVHLRRGEKQGESRSLHGPDRADNPFLGDAVQSPMPSLLLSAKLRGLQLIKHSALPPLVSWSICFSADISAVLAISKTAVRILVQRSMAISL